MAHAYLQRSRSLTRAAPSTGAKVADSKQKENCSGQQWARGIRDGISRGREWIAVIADIADIAVIARDRKENPFPQIASVERPLTWHGKGNVEPDNRGK
jgi:hypothetical protein